SNLKSEFWILKSPLARRALSLVGAGVYGMPRKANQAAGDPAVEQVLGYLNFSSGAADLQFLANLNRLFESTAQHKTGLPVWLEVSRLLTDQLAQKRQQSAAFRDADQAAAVLELVFDQTLPAYRRFHRDLLF